MTLKISNKHIIYWRIFGFVVLVVSMVILNRYVERGQNDEVETSVVVFTVDVNSNGVTPLGVDIPNSCEASLPIKMISNPYSDLMVLSQVGFNLKINYMYQHFKNRYIKTIYRLQLFYILARDNALKNKDIR